MTIDEFAELFLPWVRRLGKKRDADRTTALGDCFPEAEAGGRKDPAEKFKDIVISTLEDNAVPHNEWPDDWRPMNIDRLAQALLEGAG